ncbi:MAG: lipopolysaccharide core heptose(II) kinase RfaY [Halodesulfurarchaeum sp.]
MVVRRFVRGRVSWQTLEVICREFATRYDQPVLRVEFFDENNWLSTPCVVNDRLFLKIVSRQNAIVHTVFTGARNLGAVSSGTEGFFERFESPLEMARHEVDATRRMREIGLNAPEPIEAFQVSGMGVLVLEYLDGISRLDDVPENEIDPLVDSLFEALATMHDHGLAHGDLRSENVLVRNGEIYFIDATAVNEGRMADARGYDLASALAAVEPLVGARRAVEAAGDQYPVQVLLDAIDFLDFVNIRPDHDFDAAAVKGEMSKVARN